MVEKSLSKFNNNFLQKFLINSNCKVELESKIETNNAVSIENTGNYITQF